MDERSTASPSEPTVPSSTQPTHSPQQSARAREQGQLGATRRGLKHWTGSPDAFNVEVHTASIPKTNRLRLHGAPPAAAARVPREGGAVRYSARSCSGGQKDVVKEVERGALAELSLWCSCLLYMSGDVRSEGLCVQGRVAWRVGRVCGALGPGAGASINYSEYSVIMRQPRYRCRCR